MQKALSISLCLILLWEFAFAHSFIDSDLNDTGNIKSQRDNHSDERIVTDLISFETGVEIDFNYNETLQLPTDIISAPGCPRSHEGRPWVYYGSKCYIVGFRGPCPFGRRIFYVNNSKYGACNCDCFAVNDTALTIISMKVEPNANNEVLIFHPRYIFGRTSKMRLENNESLTYRSENEKETKTKAKNAEERYSFCFSPSLERLVTYDGLRQECHAFLDQGPCKSGEWLIRSIKKKNGIECETRKCPEYSRHTEKNSGGGFTYFDYRRQECLAQVYGNLQETFFANVGAFTTDRQKFCQNAGMRYSHILRTCVKDIKAKLNFMVG